MADLKAQLEITADASGVEAGVGRAKRSLKDLGVTAQAEGRKAKDSLGGIGEGGDQSAQKIDRATRQMIGSIERTTAKLEAGSRTGSKYFEVLAQQRGVNVDALRPYLAQLDAVQSKQQAVTAAVAASAPAIQQVGMSAKATSAALRGVPAQFTDIVTSLQGGQAPLTVFLQQGGQLKDMFGGIGPAARALGGYIGGLINPVTIAAAAVATLGLAYFQGSKEAQNFASSVILSGNAAGVTVGQLQLMAQRISTVGATQGAAAEALAQFAASGEIAGDKIERFSAIALRMEKLTGQAVKATVKEFEELGRSPVQASEKLNQGTNYLTASIYQQIRALDQQGRAADAAALAQKSYADALDTRLGGVADRLGTLERAWNGVVLAAKKGWDAMLGIGRTQEGDAQVASAQANVERLQQSIAQRRSRGMATGDLDRQYAAAVEHAKTLSATVSAQNALAAGEAKSAAQAKARVSFDKEGEQFASNKLKMEKAITEAINEGKAAGATQKEIQERIAAIRAKYTDKGAASAGLRIDRAQLGLDVESIRSASEALIGTYTNSERIMESVRSAGLLSDREYFEAKRAFINLEADARESALQKEITRYQQEKLAGAAALDNQKKIADAQGKIVVLRASAAAQLTILANQEEAASKRLEVGYLTARQAAQDYFDTINRQQDRTVAALGQGQRQNNFDSGLSQIEDRYASQRRDLENTKAQLELEGKFTAEARAQYEQRLKLIEEFQGKSIASYTAYYARLVAAEGDWGMGANAALTNYQNQATNVFDSVGKAFTGAFKGMEDALVAFVTTGKLDFKTLANSIIEDITRIIVQAQITAPLAKMLQGGMTSGSGLGGLLSSGLSALFGGNASSAFSTPDGRAAGGPVSAGGLYRVNERRPELLSVAGSQYLMMGSQGGKVTPDAGGGRQVTNNISVQVDGAVDSRTRNQIANDVARQIRYAEARFS